MEYKALLVGCLILVAIGLAVLRVYRWHTYVNNRKIKPVKTKKYVEKVLAQRKGNG